MKTVLIAATFAAGITASARGEEFALPGTTDPLPAGVTVQLTYEGPTFADENGMTVYWTRIDVEPNISKCTDLQWTTAFHEGTLFTYMLPYPYEYAPVRRTCIEKFPPFQPVEGAKPVGKWKIIERPDGLKQWTYEGRPLYKYMFDKVPGEAAERGWRRAMTSPVYMPAGIQIIKTTMGLALGDRDGMTLYTNANDTKDMSICDVACSRTWTPVTAAAGAADSGPWSLLRRPDGQKQWAYDGKPVYTYPADEVPAAVDGAMENGWSPLILIPVPTPPEGIKITETPEGPVYTDKNGMTIYWLICHEENAEHLSCDREGDTMAYMHGLCGGPERCADTFKLIKVTDESRKEDKLWSIRKVDLKNPLRKLGDDEEGTKVWLYQRRLVFTYGGDEFPAQMYANGIRLQQLADVVYLPAYGAPAL
ncbi:MAG: hypothetical protein KDE14_07100 [Rhodobacteraceae bacterium]|nr:hypothetical protein [Paracoccaceae bacterium]